jgi:cytochrome P450
MDDSQRCPVDRGVFEWPTATTKDYPFPYYEALRGEREIYKHPDRDEFYVSRADDLLEVARRTTEFSNDLFSAAPALRDMINSGDGTMVETAGEGRRLTTWASGACDPPDHTMKRHLIRRLVSRERMASYDAMIEQHANTLIDQWIDRGSCELRDEFADWLPVRVIADIMGLPDEDAPSFRTWGDIEAGGAGRYASPERLESDTKKYQAAQVYLREAIINRHETPTDDFLTELIQGQIAVDGSFDLDYLVNEASLLLFAGNVTTAHLIANTVVMLSEDDDLMQRVKTDHSLIPAVIDECLRHQSPVQWTQRLCKVDAEVGGVTIPAGSWVIMYWASGNRDEAVWDEPTAVNLDRPGVAKKQLAFGVGIHRCVGAPLAELEGQIALRVLLDRLDDIKVDHDEGELRNIDSVRFRVPRRVAMTFTARERVGSRN